MQIQNTLSNKRLTKEASIIRQNIISFLLDEITKSGISLSDITRIARVNENKFVDGSITLTQLIKICFTLDISPSEIMKQFYDDHKVIIK